MTSIGTAGTGISGLRLALTLQHADIDTTLYAERTPDDIRGSRLMNTVSSSPRVARASPSSSRATPRACRSTPRSVGLRDDRRRGRPRGAVRRRHHVRPGRWRDLRHAVPVARQEVEHARLERGGILVVRVSTICSSGPPGTASKQTAVMTPSPATRRGRTRASTRAAFRVTDPLDIFRARSARPSASPGARSPRAASSSPSATRTSPTTPSAAAARTLARAARTSWRTRSCATSPTTRGSAAASPATSGPPPTRSCASTTRSSRRPPHVEAIPAPRWPSRRSRRRVRQPLRRSGGHVAHDRDARAHRGVPRPPRAAAAGDRRLAHARDLTGSCCDTARPRRTAPIRSCSGRCRRACRPRSAGPPRRARAACVWRAFGCRRRSPAYDRRT